MPETAQLTYLKDLWSDAEADKSATKSLALLRYRCNLLVALTLLVLVGSTVIVGYGNYIAQPASAVPSGH